MQIIIGLFALIDYWIYKLVGQMFNLIFMISEVDIFTEPAINSFSTRIYGFLGVFILFKIVISCIQYLINPDKLVDKEKGIAGLIQRTIISIALIALVPHIFYIAKDVQKTICKVIPTFVLGIEMDSDVNLQGVGDWLSLETLKSFIEVKSGKELSAVFHPINDMETFRDNIAEGCGFFNAKACIYNYQWILSVPLGIFLVYILLSMGIDIAIRSIKMGLLQILAPIPIASYVNSQETFKKWYQTAFKVYADLFIRLFVVWLIVYVLSMISSGKISIGDNIFVKLYIIVALLLFAKQAPKFLCEILGIKSDGFGSIGEMFKPAWQRAGGFAAGAGMLTAGMYNALNKGVNVASNVNKANGIAAKLKEAAKGALAIGGSAVAGATSAGIHGGLAALQGKNGKEVMAAGHKRAVTARQNRELDKLNGVTWMDRAVARLSDYGGLDTKASLAEGKQKAYSTLHQDVGNYKKAVMARVTKEANVAIRNEVNANSAVSQLGKLMEDNHTTIMSSGNADLINFSNKFERATDSDGRSCWKLRAGESLSYHDLAAINADAKQAGIGSIAGLTDENGALTLLAQKELFEDAMNNKVYTTTGQLHKTINAHSGENITYVNNITGATETINIATHTDISTAVGQAEQHLTENAVSLGTLSWVDPNTNELRSVSGADQLKGMFNSNFGKLDDLAQRASAELSSQMSGDKNAAARASIQRRDNNKKS